jgi:hypothetical protein
MRRILVVVAVGLGVVACSYSRPLAVRSSDLAAWTQVPVIQLETHPMFASMQRKVQLLSDGGELWIYSACEQWIEDRRCAAIGGSSWAIANCSGGRVGQDCCHNQFYVRDQTVSWYRAAGACFTNCGVRPVSRACTAEERAEN